MNKALTHRVPRDLEPRTPPETTLRLPWHLPEPSRSRRRPPAAPVPDRSTRPEQDPATGIVARRRPCARREGEREGGYLPLSRTTDQVLAILLEGDLYRLRAESVAESLGISCTTLRRRLRNDHTNYQFLLDRARQYRCESRLRERWLPGKCMADELGYLEVNSFYRAFRRWTGVSYSEYKQREFP